MFTGCGDGVVRAYDAKSGTMRKHYTAHEGAVNAIAVVKDKIYTASSDATLRVWDAKDLMDELELGEEPAGGACAAAAHPDTFSAVARDLESRAGGEEEINEDGLDIQVGSCELDN